MLRALPTAWEKGMWLLVSAVVAPAFVARLLFVCVLAYQDPATWRREEKRADDMPRYGK